MTRRFGLIGVPSSAGAHTPGQEKGPWAMRQAGILERLDAAGCAVQDHGDLPQVRSRPDRANRRAQNLPLVVQVARSLAERVETVLRSGQTPLVLGGDCSITVGVVSGFLRAGQDPTLLYFDGGVDLYVPETQPEGHMDSMAVAHLLDEPGAAPELSGIGPRQPLLEPERVLYFGQGSGSPDDPEGVALARLGIRQYPLERVQAHPEQAAAEARRAVELDGGPFLVHFDVDVLDFVDSPIADVPQYDRGLTLDEAMASLRVFAASPQFAGLVVAEFNPDHADADGAEARRFVAALAAALGS